MGQMFQNQQQIYITNGSLYIYILYKSQGDYFKVELHFGRI